MKTVIYHSADYDGIFCKEISKRFLGVDNVNYIGWNFGDPPIDIPKEGTIYIMDLSPDCLCKYPKEPKIHFDDLQAIPWDRIIWIDHHKTSIEKWMTDIDGCRIDGVAACRLVWQWFASSTETLARQYDSLPTKQDYIDRKVDEPYAVRLAGEYDIWDKRDPNAEIFQYSLRACEIDWDKLWTSEHSFNQPSSTYMDKLLADGRIAQRYGQHLNESLVKSRSFSMNWEGLHWLCLNTGQFNSLTFAAKDIPETGHDALLGFMWNGRVWTVSLYHANHRKDIDLSEIAKRHKGGGHKGACGFTCRELPFKLI